MRKNQALAKWRQGEQTIGAWLSLANTHSAEMLANAGFDWLCIDLQHGLMDYGDLRHMLPAISTTDVTPMLAEVRVPTLILAPTKSAATPMAEQERIAAALPRADLVRIAGEGHEIYIDRPEECVSALRSFLWQFR